jgi:hypothetical protein
MTRRTSWLALGLVVVVSTVVALASVYVEPLPDPPPPPTASDVEPVAGSWVCPVGDGREGTEVRATVARPPGSGDQPAEVELEVFEAGERHAGTLPRLFPEAATSRSPSFGSGGAVGATWRDGPVALQREWVLGGDEFPSGLVAGGCVEPLADQWIIPGMVTSGGSQALLRIANPFPTDATIGLRFVGTEGPVAPLALRNLSVEARSTLEIDVNEFLPERTDLAAIVDVASGRVATQGVQLVRSAIGGIDGVSVLDAATEPTEVWTVPWVVDRDDAASWLWVYNPGDRVAPVELSYHTTEGGDIPQGLTEVLVDPGALQRIDLRGTTPEDEEVVAVTARSDGAPIVVSSAVELGGDDVDRTAFVVQLGNPASDASWTVSGGPTEGRVEQLHLVNPGSEEATASVSLFTGVTVERPDDLTSVTVPPGGRRILTVMDGERALEEWTAFVAVEQGELVVGRVGGAGEGPRHMVSVAGVPSSSWRTQSAETTLARAEGMVHRLRTSLGIIADDVPRPDTPAPPPTDEQEPAPPADEQAPPPDEDEFPEAEPDEGFDADVEEADVADEQDAGDPEEGPDEPHGDLPGDGPGAGAPAREEPDGDEDGDDDATGSG